MSPTLVLFDWASACPCTRLPWPFFFAIGGSGVFLGASFFFNPHVFAILNPSSGSFNSFKYSFANSLFFAAHISAMSSLTFSNSSCRFSIFDASCSIARLYLTSSFFSNSSSSSLFDIVLFIRILLKHLIIILLTIESHLSAEVSS
jgi:hypothetical protein